MNPSEMLHVNNQHEELFISTCYLFVVRLHELRGQLLPPALPELRRRLSGSESLQRRSLVAGDPFLLLRGQGTETRAVRLHHSGLLLLLNDFNVLSKAESR